MLARNIRAARVAHGWSQADLARRLKVSRVAVTQWEGGGDSQPSLRNLQKLARLFDLSIDDLLTGKARAS